MNDFPVLEIIPFFKNVAVGISTLFCLMWFNIFCWRHVSLHYEISARANIANHRYNRVFINFFAALIYLVLGQIVSIVYWTFVLHLLNLTSDPLKAIVFVASCYTTVGIVPDTITGDWQLRPVFIALSGLFSVALGTAAMLNMSTLFRHAWLRKHAARIRVILDKKNVTIPEFAAIEDAAKAKAAAQAAQATAPSPSMAPPSNPAP